MKGNVNFGTELPFEEAIQFLRQKVNLPTRHWDDLYRNAHGRAFMVAGAQQTDLLSDLRSAVDDAIARGQSFQQFQAQFDGLVEKHGWVHTGGRAWRARIIYETNVRTAYQAGRYAQMTEPSFLDGHPYWQYRHQDSKHPRPLHKSWNGLVLPADHPWWKTHYAPNGWGCKCRIFPLSERGLKRLGKSVGPVPDDGEYEWTDRYGHVQTIPNGIDPGWDYAPSREWFADMTPRPAQGPELIPRGTPSSLPIPGNIRQVSAERLLPTGQTDESYVKRFLEEFDPDGKPAFVPEPTGGMLALNEEMFKDGKGRWKIKKRGRETAALLMADAIKAPDEVWLQWYQEPDSTRYVLYKTFLAWFEVEGELNPLFVMMRMGRDDWEGVTAFRANEDYIKRQRFGRLLYERKAQ